MNHQRSASKLARQAGWLPSSHNRASPTSEKFQALPFEGISDRGQTVETALSREQPRHQAKLLVFFDKAIGDLALPRQSFSRPAQQSARCPNLFGRERRGKAAVFFQ